MHATCPSSADHRVFITVAQVTEHWLVDETGVFIQIARGSHSETVAAVTP